MSYPAAAVHLSKRFRIGEAHDSLRDLLAAGFRRILGRVEPEKESTSFWALRDVSFSVAQGDALGIIGPNGAGKSTILRLLAGILHPDHGEVRIRGRLAALIEVGAGFHGDLTGRENIFLNGAILGMSRAEIRAKLDDIVEFAGIERFLDMPVKRYSSGMYARLGFSIAAHVDPDVLLVDEVLSVGDAVFRLRCMERMRALVDAGTTLIFVTHNLDQMQAICPRALVLESGTAVFEGPSRDAVGHYMQAVSRAYADRPTDSDAKTARESSLVEVEHLRFFTGGDEPVVWMRSRDSVRAELAFRLRRPVERLVVELNLRASAGENLLSFNSGRDDREFHGMPGAQTLTLALPSLPLSGGQYFWNIRMWDAQSGETILDTPLKYPMVIDDEGRATGRLTIDRTWGFVSPVSKTDRGGMMPATRSCAATEDVDEDLLLR